MSHQTDLLRNVTIFRGLDDYALSQLGNALHSVCFERNAVIVGQDDAGDALYIIESGRVKVVLSSDDGREVILSTFRQGDFFGEMSLLDGRPRSATVVACEDSRVLVLERREFVRHLRQNPTAGLNILEVMSLRLRQADEVIGNLALLDVYGRVARVLMGMAERDGRPSDEGVVIENRPTQQELASMSGTSRETVSRVLSEFQKRGFIWMQGRMLVLSSTFAAEGLSVEGA